MTRRGERRQRLRLAVGMALLLVPALTSYGATPLGGQRPQERLDRRQGDRQLQARLDAPRLYDTMRSDLMQPQARPAGPGTRAREWDANLVPRQQQFDDQLDKQRRVRSIF